MLNYSCNHCNVFLRKSLAKLSEHIRALTARVNLLEKEVYKCTRKFVWKSKWISCVFQSSDEGVDLSYRSPTASAPFCPHYTDCTCLANRWEKERQTQIQSQRPHYTDCTCLTNRWDKYKQKCKDKDPITPTVHVWTYCHNLLCLH